MGKNFLEVFPELNIAEDLKELLKLVEVERWKRALWTSSSRISGLP